MADPAEPPRRPAETVTGRVFAAAEHREIPLRSIIASVTVVVVAGLLLLLVWVLRADLLLMAVAAFIAVLLVQPVAMLQRTGLPRFAATSIVFVIGLIVFGGIVFFLGDPLVRGVNHFTREVPSLVRQAQHGKGTIGRLIVRFHLQAWVKKNLPKLSAQASSIARPALSFGAAAATTLLRLLTIAVLAFYLLLDLPRIWRGFLGLMPAGSARRVDIVARESSLGVTGYMAGNVATSVIAGIVVLISLLVFGVPFAGLLALWVALVDLLPLVGGLLAGVPTVIVAFLHSTPAGIGMLVIFIVYQQVENHVLNPVIMSKTVKMSPLLVLLAVVIGATLGGRIASGFGTFIGALMGIPIGSAIQVVVREIRKTAPQAAGELPMGEVPTAP